MRLVQRDDTTREWLKVYETLRLVSSTFRALKGRLTAVWRLLDGDTLQSALTADQRSVVGLGGHFPCYGITERDYAV